MTLMFDYFLSLDINVVSQKMEVQWKTTKSATNTENADTETGQPTKTERNKGSENAYGPVKWTFRTTEGPAQGSITSN